MSLAKTVKDGVTSFLNPRKGGVRVPHNKHTAESATVVMPAPAKLILSMSQHLGTPCEPIVKVGDTVKMGQLIGDSPQPVTAPVHTGVSGTVTAIRPLILSNRRVLAVELENDGQYTPDEQIGPVSVSNREEFLKAVRASGLVGLGGAGFPPHIKLNPKNLDEVDTLVVNVAECEPYLTTDYRECLENTDDVFDGIQTVMRFLDLKRAVIGFEDNMPKAIELFRQVAADRSTAERQLEVCAMPSRYPRGAEKVLIYACTGRKVPPGKLPADVGCLVMNVTSLGALARYLKTGMPLIARRLTVDGSAILTPQNVMVTIGSRVQDVLDFCGVDGPIEQLIIGGPMMGTTMADGEMPILKQNNGILAFKPGDKTVKRVPESACIRCGKCVEVCPMRLMPTALEKDYAAGDVEALKKHGVMVCIECGCCSYTCPARRPLVQAIRLGKGLVQK